MKNKVVQGLWIGDELSLLEQLSIKSFLDNGHEYHLYVYNDVKNIPEGTIIKDANEIIDESEIYKNTYFSLEYGYLGFSDYFRVKLIYDKGGFWVDTDLVCLKYFDFEEDYVFTHEISHVKDGISSSIFKCPKNSIFLKDMYDDIHSSPFEKTDEGNILYIFREYVKKYGFENYIKDSKLFSTVDLTNITSIISKKYDRDLCEGCYSVHLLRQFWLIKRNRIKREKDSAGKRIRLKSVLDVNKIYSEDTLYGYWQRKYL
jgi:hypothetical protein